MSARTRPRTAPSGSPGGRRGRAEVHRHAEVGAVDPPAGPELVGDPEGVARGDREAEVVVELAAACGRSRRRGQAAADHAEPAAAEVGQQGAAVAGVERGVDLDQAAELPGAELQPAVEPATYPRLTEWARPNGLPITSTGLPSRGPRGDGRPPARAASGSICSRVRPVSGSAATHCAGSRRPEATRATTGDADGGRVDPDREDVPVVADHHPRGHPPGPARARRPPCTPAPRPTPGPARSPRSTRRSDRSSGSASPSAPAWRSPRRRRRRGRAAAATAATAGGGGADAAGDGGTAGPRREAHGDTGDGGQSRRGQGHGGDQPSAASAGHGARVEGRDGRRQASEASAETGG